jgi:pimeloyl-ACP methyl ester carboxylesterase
MGDMNRPVDLAIRESGPADAPAVVYLHGVGNSGVMWASHMAALSEYRCIAPDLPGHGSSHDLAWVSRQETAARVARLIEDLPVPRAHLVGLSLGGSVAFELVATRPELLDRVIIDGCGAVGSRLAGPMKAIVAAVSPLVRQRAFGRLLAAALGITEPTALDDFIGQLGQVDPRSFRRAFADAQDVRIDDRLRGAACPTLLVSAEKELSVIHESGRRLAFAMPHAEAWVMPGAGHGWLGRDSDVHIAMVRSWIEDRPLPGELQPLRPQSPQATTG